MTRVDILACKVRGNQKNWKINKRKIKGLLNTYLTYIQCLGKKLLFFSRTGTTLTSCPKLLIANLAI
ncbi:MAG: hypothetical protein DCF20_20905 [Pseudanabaena sp.]|nr:MAG: hypothetical protein DCF20_20905 [Pseudanabaena sp.]